MKKLWIIAWLLLFTGLASAEQKYTNFCTVGGQKVVSQGLTSTTQVQVSYENEGGCTSYGGLSVMVNAPVINGPSQSCVGTTGVQYTTEVGMSDYIWSVVGGSNIIGQGTSSISLDWGTELPFSVAVTYTNPITGCTSTTQMDIGVYPTPSLQITNDIGPAILCKESTVVL